MSGLDRELQHPARLRMMAMLTAASELEFAALRDELEVSDSVLSKHVAALCTAGYASSRKGSHQGRRTTWIKVTATGRRALGQHIAALRSIIDTVEPG